MTERQRGRQASELSMQGLAVDLEPVEGDEVVVAGVDEDPQAVSPALSHVQALLLQLVVRALQLCNNRPRSGGSALTRLFLLL